MFLIRFPRHLQSNNPVRYAMLLGRKFGVQQGASSGCKFGVQVSGSKFRGPVLAVQFFLEVIDFKRSQISGGLRF